MLKLRTLGIKEASLLGISRLVKDAEDEGVLVIERTGVGVALVMSITLRGFEKIQSIVSEVLQADTSKLDGNPDLQAFVNQLKGHLRNGAPVMGELADRLELEKPKKKKRKPREKVG